ncbi:MAG: NUDIX domain-containing protein [Myxococcota bacterium]
MTDPRRAAVRTLLLAHAPADDQEASFVQEMLALCEAEGDPFARDHFAPGHFTASAFVSDNAGARILLVHHGKLHRWLQPGGHFEPTDPDVWAACQREVAEETGLADVTLADGHRLLDVDIHEIPSLRGDPPHRHYDLRVHLRCNDPEAEAVAGSDARAVRWVPLRGDPEAVLGGESDESVLRALRRLARA